MFGADSELVAANVSVLDVVDGQLAIGIAKVTQLSFYLDPSESIKIDGLAIDKRDRKGLSIKEPQTGITCQTYPSFIRSDYSSKFFCKVG